MCLYRHIISTRVLLCSWPMAGELLDPAEICDLLKGVVLIVCCVIMHYIDVSMMYHIIRGQTVIKLYIFFNMLDVRAHTLSTWCSYSFRKFVEFRVHAIVSVSVATVM